MNLRNFIVCEIIPVNGKYSRTKTNMLSPRSIGVEVLSGKTKILGELNDV